MRSLIIRILVAVIALTVAIYFHNDIFKMGVNMKLSFTLSMILPYVIEFFFVCSILFQLYSKVFSSGKLWLRRLISGVVFIGGCGIAFAVNPIYQGDFGSVYQPVQLSGEHEDTFVKGLTMVSRTGCPYCHSRFDQLIDMGELYPELEIKILITDGNVDSGFNRMDSLEVEHYKELSTGISNISVDFFPDPLLNPLQIYQFPTLIYVEDVNSSPLNMKKWINSGFGAAAWDNILDTEGL